MALRDQRQKEFADIWLDSSMFGILHLAPRFGKCRVGIRIMQAMQANKVLIAYPDEKIKHSWEDDLSEMDYHDSEITYTTHLSIWKHIGEEYDLVIIDECHLLSEAQIQSCGEVFRLNKRVLGLSGTISSETEKVLYNELNLPIIAEYPIEQGIKEGIITDYEIIVVKVPLDNKTLQKFGKTTMMSEKRKFDQFTYLIKTAEKNHRDTKFLKLSRMRIIQGSIAKLNKTREIINSLPGKRILVFCGTIKAAGSLGIDSYHSKSGKSNVFQEFVNGNIDKLAVVKVGNTGVTYTPLSKVIISYFDSNPENLCQKINRAMSFEYDNEDKKAKIIIISSTEDTELNWLRNALEFFDKNKVKYV